MPELGWCNQHGLLPQVLTTHSEKKGRGQHCVNRTLSCVAARDLGTSLTCSRHTFLSQLINVEGPGPRMDSGPKGGELLLGRLSVS